MTTPDSTPPEGDNVISLSVSDVTDIISRAKGAAGDPISVATQLFSALGENVTVSGRHSPLVLFQSWVLCRM